MTDVDNLKDHIHVAAVANASAYTTSKSGTIINDRVKTSSVN